MSGIITADNAASHCQLSTNESGVKPYQSTTDTGPDRAVDYSIWKFVPASTIKQGSDNKVEPKIPAVVMVSYLGILPLNNSSKMQ